MRCSASVSVATMRAKEEAWMAGVPGSNTNKESGFPSSSSEPLPLTAAMVTLASLGKRPDGWDGDDTVAPARETVAAARRWLTDLSQIVARTHLPWHDPHITATPDGDILFEWWRGERKLSVYAAGDEIAYIMTWKEAGEIRQDDGDARGAEAQAHIWSWLIG